MIEKKVDSDTSATVEKSVSTNPSKKETDGSVKKAKAKKKSRAKSKKKALKKKKPYPSVLLERALQVPAQIKEKNGGNAWTPLDVATAIGVAPKSSDFFYVTAASRDFGMTVGIQSTIVNELLDADLVIADLTDHNPNVMFELGLRMAEDKPVAIIKAEGTGRVFDVDNMLRVFEYDPNLWRSTIEVDAPNLSKHLTMTWENRKKDKTYMSILRNKENRS